jgi:hypothetical protein
MASDSASSAVPMPRLPDKTGAIASPHDGRRSIGSEPDPIWLSIGSSVTV